MTPLFSIIIPAYNVSSLVRQAIDSCLSQEEMSANEFEVIVIDDGSTDETAQIVDSYLNNPNVHILHSVNSGLSATRNKGIQIAKGEYLIFLDADDWLHPKLLSTLKPLIEDNELIVFPMIYSYEGGEEFVWSYGLEERQYTANEFAKETLGQMKFNITPAPCKLYRKSFLIGNRLSFIEGILHEDGPFFIDVLCNVKTVRYIDKGLYYYRQGRKDSITTKMPTYKNFEGLIIGQEHTIRNAGLGNKAINTYLLNINVSHAFMGFDSKETFHQVVAYYRKWQVRKRMFVLACRSMAKLKFRIYGFAMTIDPYLPKLIRRVIGR